MNNVPCNTVITSVTTPTFKATKYENTYQICQLTRNTWHVMNLNEKEVSMIASLLDGSIYTKGGDE